MLIPRFPHWISIDDSSRSYIDYYAKKHRFSDFNFINLYAWDVRDSGQVTNLNDNLAILIPDYITGVPYFSFVGTLYPRATAETLLDYAAQVSGRRVLNIIPEIVVGALMGVPGVVVAEDIDSHDYVLDLVRLASMEGSAFAHLRRSYGQFLAAHGAVAVFCRLDIGRQDVREAIVNVFIMRASQKVDVSHTNEFVAICRLLNSDYIYQLDAFGVMIKGRLAAFIIIEYYDEEWCLGHFWKADTNYVGIYSFLMCSLAKQLASEGYKLFNIEQDLGIEGLRQAKQFFHPVTKLKKYTVTDSRSQVARETAAI